MRPVWDELGKDKNSPQLCYLGRDPRFEARKPEIREDGVVLSITHKGLPFLPEIFSGSQAEGERTEILLFRMTTNNITKSLHNTNYSLFKRSNREFSYLPFHSHSIVAGGLLDTS